MTIWENRTYSTRMRGMFTWCSWIMTKHLSSWRAITRQHHYLFSQYCISLRIHCTPMTKHIKWSSLCLLSTMALTRTPRAQLVPLPVKWKSSVSKTRFKILRCMISSAKKRIKIWLRLMSSGRASWYHLQKWERSLPGIPLIIIPFVSSITLTLLAIESNRSPLEAHYIEKHQAILRAIIIQGMNCKIKVDLAPIDMLGNCGNYQEENTNIQPLNQRSSEQEYFGDANVQ